MTRDELIETALQCGVWVPMERGQEHEQTIDRLQRFVGRAVAEEREACAKVCEARYMGDNNREDLEAKRCAAAIRARGDT